MLLAVMLLPGALAAQVPAIADIPDDLPAPRLLQLTQARSSLVQRRDQIKGRVAEQKAQCGAVLEGTSQEQTCQVSKAELLTAINLYAADVRRFNDDVAAAIAMPEPQPVTKPTAIQTGAAAAVVGDVFWLTHDGRRVSIKPGSPIFLNEHIITRPSGRLQVLLLDETVFTLGPSSDMVLDEYVYDPKTSAGKITASVAQGAFRFVTGKIAHQDPAKVRIKIAVGTIGVRGTDFEAMVEPGGAGYIKLFKGQLDITETKTGAIVTLNAGQLITFTADGTFGLPTPLKSGPPAESASLHTKASCLHHHHRKVIENSPEGGLHVPSPTLLHCVYGGKAAAAHVFLPRPK